MSLQTTAALKPSRKLKLLKGEQGEVFVCPPVYFPMARNIEIKARIESVKALLPRIKILLFSGQAATADLLEKARAQGYEFEILAKPVHPQDLLTKLRQ